MPDYYCSQWSRSSYSPTVLVTTQSYCTSDGPASYSLTSDGLTSDGLTSDGPTSDGLISDGPKSDCPAGDGLASDGPTSDPSLMSETVKKVIKCKYTRV